MWPLSSVTISLPAGRRIGHKPEPRAVCRQSQIGFGIDQDGGGERKTASAQILGVILYIEKTGQIGPKIGVVAESAVKAWLVLALIRRVR
jgi:hypothetical protein